MKKVHIAPKNKSFNGQRPFCEVPLVRAISLGAVMAALLSGVSPVFASHLSSTGSKVQSVSAGVVSTSVAHGRVGVANGDRSCGVDQVVSRSSSRSGKKVSAKEQYKKLAKNRLSDGSGGYSFESSCGADASVNALKSASTHSSVDLDVAESDWFLEENGVINWPDNTRSVNATGARVVSARGTPKELLCMDGRGSLCIGKDNYANPKNDHLIRQAVIIGAHSEARIDRPNVGDLNGAYDPITNGLIVGAQGPWRSNRAYVSIGVVDSGTVKVFTRQITGVAAGRHDSDVVNVAQLKEFRKWREENIWNLYIKEGDKRVDAGGIGTVRGLGLLSGNGIMLNHNSIGKTTTVLMNLDRDLQLKTGRVGIKGADIWLGDFEGSQGSLGGNKIKNVAEGGLSKTSQEAVTGKQLYEVNETVKGLTGNIEDVQGNVTTLDTNINKYLGGGANVLNGKQPVYTVQTKQYNGVEAAFKGVDNTLTDFYKKLGDVESAASKQRLIVQDPSSHVITIGKDVDGTEIKIANRNGVARKLTGLVDGDISDKSTDAVTGKQLYKTTQTVTGLTSTVSGVEKNITDFDAHLSLYLGGGADVLKGKAPTYTIQTKRYNDVGAAFKGVDDSLTVLFDKIESVEGSNLVLQEEGTKVITIGAKAEGDKISIANKDKAPRKLTGLAEGDVSDKSTEAVTGQQLFALNNKVSAYLGGEADLLNNKAPTYTIQTKRYNDVGAAFKGVDDSLTVLFDKIESVEGNNLVLQEEDTHTITIGAKVDGDEISLVNKDAGVRVLSGVAEGDLSKDSTDAVTGKQLYKTTQTVTGLTSTVSGVEKNITDFDAHLSMYLGGGADVLKGTAPTYTIQTKRYNDIGAAFKGVDDSLTVLFDKIESVEGNNLVVQEKDTHTITIGAKVDGDEISLVNKDAGVRVVSGVAEGDLSKDSTDAVTGKQLYKTSQTVTGLTSTVSGVEKNITDFDAHLSMYLGGGADVLKGTAPTYTIQDKKHNNIASAFEGVDSSLEDLSARVDDATGKRLARAEGNQLVVQDSGSKLITIGKDVDGDEISLVNKDAEVRVLSGVAEGDLSKDSTDAVTGKQLYKTTQTVAGLTSTVSGVEKNITDFDAHLSMYLGGGADVLKGTAPTYTIQDKKT
ncbi:hypothetical protein [Bartonella bovis]|uniref:Surface protein/Bartonella adhesin n=1 Tax=Bartonella bovis m02 TaxID=1094492 RepID=N6ULH2_9HYPH|nr:hypothetical protein [Bartonella bovis]ENN93264.1 surface protein/Bartonella adhesin [Bartonella bovis m02]